MTGDSRELLIEFQPVVEGVEGQARVVSHDPNDGRLSVPFSGLDEPPTLQLLLRFGPGVGLQPDDVQPRT